MICYICGEKVESIFFMHDDNPQYGFHTASINNQSYILCDKCYKDWAKILEHLLNYFHKLGKIIIKKKGFWKWIFGIHNTNIKS